MWTTDDAEGYSPEDLDTINRAIDNVLNEAPLGMASLTGAVIACWRPGITALDLTDAMLRRLGIAEDGA